jgi:hypothetical protein
MMIRCPICRADNDDDTGPACRRCKADLAPLVELEERRALALGRAAQALAFGDASGVLRHARQAQVLRAGADVSRWLAVGHLLYGDFAQARAHYRFAIAVAAGAAT